MSRQPLTEDLPGTKRRKVPATLRKSQILALELAGLTQNEIAAKLGVTRSTITRDLEELRPAKQAVPGLLNDVQAELKQLISPREIAQKLVDLAKNAKNEAVSQGVIRDLIEYAGDVTEKERLRAKTQASPEPQPMFVLPTGATLNFTFNTQNNKIQAADTTTSGKNDVVECDDNPTQ